MASLQIGQMINEYRILDRLGEGGMGVVYKALDTSLDRVVAVKTIGAGLADDKIFWERFRREAKALAKLDDPNIVTIFALRETEIGLLMVMEFVDGITLSQKIKQTGLLRVADALPIVKQILAALNHAHQLGIIHRDIKPGNVMLTSKGEVKVTDFGLAKIQHTADATMTMAPIGTLLYMSPEQAKNFKQIDQRSDLYSLGMTFYEMLAGRTPFEAEASQINILNAIDKGDLPSPEKFNAGLPRELCRIVMKALAADAKKRFQSAAEMLAAITKFEATLPPRTKLFSGKLEAIAKFEAMPPQRKRFFSGFVAPLVVGIALVLASLLLEYHSPWFNKTELGKKVEAPEDSSTVNVPRTEKETPPSKTLTHSPLLMELASITEMATLQNKLTEYRRAMQIAVGKEDEFESLEGCYLFVCDAQRVLGVFQFKSEVYYAVNSAEIYPRLPEQFSGKIAIWVQDSSGNKANRP